MPSTYDPEALLRAIAHPTRQAILRRCDGQPCSPSEIAAELPDPDETVQRVVYHIKLLKRVDLIQKTGTRKVRGTPLVKTMYRSDGWVEKVRAVLPPELLSDD